MQIRFKAPSKTFILGEYLALFGGPSLAVSTEPSFEGVFSKNLDSRAPFKILQNNIHPESPAGLWMAQNINDFLGVEFNFMDPHKGKGGFGASTAQFLFVYFWSLWSRGQLHHQVSHILMQEAWRVYRKLSKSNVPPSGADLMSQMSGGINYFSWERGSTSIEDLASFHWSFENQSFCIFRTGQKVATHEHLEEISNALSYSHVENMASIVKDARKALVRAKAFDFLLCIQAYAKELEERSWVAKETGQWIKNLYQSSNILGVKGCGALGADVLFVLCESENKESVLAFAQAVGLQKVATEDDICRGLQISMEFSGDVIVEKPNPLKLDIEAPYQGAEL